MEPGRTRVTYVRNPGFLDRVGGSLIGILVGLVLLVIASCLLFWNEGRAVQTARSLDEGMSLAITLPNPDVVSVENNGKLVHLTGQLKTDMAISDDEYGVAVRAVKLKRTVEMYQWVEHESEKYAINSLIQHYRKYDEGNGETRVEKSYSYNLEWRSDIVNSNSFDNSFTYKNPASMPVQSNTKEASKVEVGVFTLSQGLVGKITDFQRLALNNQQPVKNAQIFDGYFFHGMDPMRPQVGDIRVKFEYAGISGKTHLGPPSIVSIVARQVNNKLMSYQTLSGNALELLYPGKLSAMEIFNKEKMQNTMLTWAIRFGGWFLMFIGFSCLTSLITTLVSWIPLVREVVGMGVFIMNASFAISLSLTIIALGWIYYRPLMALTLLALAVTPYLVSLFKSGQRGYSRSRAD